jgi:hypothetical protein
MKAISARKQEDDWQAESDLDCLMRAEQVESDPKRLAAAQKLAKERLLKLAAVASEKKD